MRIALSFPACCVLLLASCSGGVTASGGTEFADVDNGADGDSSQTDGGGTNGPEEDPPVETPPDGIPDDDDLTDPGDPAVKRSYLFGLEELQGPGDHFDFDDTSHWVRSVSIHGTELTVAVDRTALEAGAGPSAEEFADFAEATFHASWHVFGGYAFDRYAVRIRADDGSDDFSLSPVGITLSAVDYGAPWTWEVLAHEMFHSWNGKFIQPEPDASDDLFQWETWLVEGGTVYYSFRHMGFVLDINEFQGGMSHRWETYRQSVGTQYDLSIPDLAAWIGDAPPGDPSTEAPSNLLYARGALVSYMLDQELRGHGVTLHDVMRCLYLDALEERRWSRPRLEEIVQSLTGTDLGPFLDQWVDSNATLPLDGVFELVE